MDQMPELNALTEKVIGLAIEIHRALGPGLLESAYRKCLCYELKHHSMQFVEEEPVSLKYKDLLIDCAYRADIIIENKLVVEIKSVDRIEPVHEAQLLTYLKLRCIKVGLILNFNVKLLKDGIVRKIL